MKYLLKPWIVALLLAICLHGVLLLWLKDQSWSVPPSLPETARLQVSLLPTSEPSANADSDLNQKEVEEKPAPNSAEPVPNAVQEVEDTPRVDDTAASKPTDTTTKTDTKVTPSSSDNTLVEKAVPPQKAFVLDEIIEPVQTSPETTQDWQRSKLLDIGNAIAPTSPKVDPKKDAFSPAFRQALQEAKQLQKEYLKGVIKKTKYPITEDADGTKYVNIKGICWKIPEPGSEEAWQIVLSGCSGQTDLIHFELNITTDILTPEQMQLLPFGGE